MRTHRKSTTVHPVSWPPVLAKRERFKSGILYHKNNSNRALSSAHFTVAPMDHSRLRASPEQRQQEQEDAIADRVRRSGLGTAAAATRCARRATYQQDAGHKADEYEEKIASSDDHEVTSHYGMRGLPGSSLRLRQGDELPPRSRANARLRGDSDDDGLQGHITHDMADDRGATVFKQAYSANASLVSHYEPSQYTSLVPRVQQHETTAPLYGVHGYAGQSAFSKTSMGFLMAQGEQIETYEAPASSEVPHNINSLDARKRRVASSTSGRQYSVTQAADDDLFEVKPSGLEAAHFLPIRSASYPGSIMDAVSHEARPPSSMTTRQQRHSHELTRLSLPPLPSRQETERTTESATAAGHESKPSKEKRRSRECKVDGCPNYIINRGLCFRHGVRVSLQLGNWFSLLVLEINLATFVLWFGVRCWSRVGGNARKKDALRAPRTRASAGNMVRTLCCESDLFRLLTTDIVALSFSLNRRICQVPGGDLYPQRQVSWRVLGSRRRHHVLVAVV